MTDLTATSAYYSGRPTLLLGGAVEAGVSDGVMSLMIEETVAGLYRCEACLGNWGPSTDGVGFLYFDRQLLDFGKPFAVEMGEAETAGTLFEGRIMALEGRFPVRRSPELTVLAEDRLQDLRMVRRTRSFEDVSDAEVMAEVARDHGLGSEVDVDGPRHRVLAQVNQSDLAFLRARARAIDAELWVAGRTLHAQARSRRAAGELTLTYGQRLREFSVLADLAGQCSSFTIGGWDVAGKTTIEERVEGAIIDGELEPRQSSGAAILAQALGARDQRIVHAMPVGDDEARITAEARLKGAVRRFVTGAGVAEGDARIRVGAKISLSGLGSLFEGAYYVTETRHTFDVVAGFRTEFRVERPGIGS